jgi:putative tryptophan/tyrosine transport system substrate-binding protein
MERRRFITLVGGAAAAWPLRVRAQQAAMPVIGVLAAPTEASYGPYIDAFRKGLKEIGYTEGQNVAIEYRWAEGQYDRLPAMAADLVARQVAVMVTIGGIPAALAAKAATSTIPIVFGVAEDPVKVGLVDSLARPNGNATGVSLLSVELEWKRLELIREVMPQAASIAILLNPKNPQTAAQLPEKTKAAKALGLQLSVLNASSDAEIDSAFSAAAQQHVSALVIGADSFFHGRREHLVELAARYALPTIYPYREEAAIGGLMSYGINLAAAYYLEGDYAGRVLKGRRPAELPVQQSTSVELVINLKTAKTLGLSFPLALLGRADEVIE